MSTDNTDCAFTWCKTGVAKWYLTRRCTLGGGIERRDLADEKLGCGNKRPLSTSTALVRIVFHQFI